MDIFKKIVVFMLFLSFSSPFKAEEAKIDDEDEDVQFIFSPNVNLNPNITVDLDGKKIGEGIIEGLMGENNIGTKLGEDLIDGFFGSLADIKKMGKFSKDFVKVQEMIGQDIINVQKKNIQEGRKALLGEIDTTVKEASKSFDKNLTEAQEEVTGTLGKNIKKTVSWATKTLDTNLSDARKDVTTTLSRELHETIDFASKEFDKDLTKATTEFSSSITKSTDIIADKISEGFGPGSKPQQAFNNVLKSLIGTVQQHLILNTGLYAAAAIAPILTVRYTYHYFIKKLNDPRIIIETSIGSWPYELSKRMLRFKPRKPKERLEHMILAPETKQHIQETIAFIKANLREGKGLGNILLTGHPGNGKTYIAKALAAELEMDYIILTGSSFFQENAGVKAIDQIFGKMTKGRKTIIFIDEIETIFASRGSNPDGDAYRFTNQLLNYTSEPNPDWILIGATNHSAKMDAASHRRFQYVVEMPLPELSERKQALTFFRNKQLMNKKNKEQVLKIFSDAKIDGISEITESLSFAELQTIIDYIRSSMRISKVGITKKIIDNAVSRVLNKEKTFNKVFTKK